jgi:P2 family phage contractile tail tube protein
MATASGILKNFQLFIENFGYSGNVEEIQLPALKIKTDEHRVGGMDAPIDVDLGMEKMETTFTLTKFDSYALTIFGQKIKTPKINVRGSVVDSDGVEKPVQIAMSGLCTGYEPGAWKAGEKPSYKFTLSLKFYQLTVDGIIIHHIDIDNMVRIIAGVDQLAATRANIGANASIITTLKNLFGV